MEDKVRLGLTKRSKKLFIKYLFHVTDTWINTASHIFFQL